MQEDQGSRGGLFRTDQKGLLPPLVTTKFQIEDFGNASPRFVRSTMYSVPAQPDMLKQTAIPFALVVSILGLRQLNNLDVFKYFGTNFHHNFFL